MGEKVFYTGANYTFPSGNKVEYGQQCEVWGPATHESHKGKGVNVLFPGIKDTASLLFTSVRRLRAAPTATPRLHPALTTLPTPRASPRQPLPRRHSPGCI